MRLLVCGAAGMLGRDVLEAAERAGHEPLGLGRSELDVTDPRAVEARLGEAAVDAVVNCAGYTDVDGAEAEPDQALRVNGAGAGNVARAAAARDVPALYVSSDYVFDGRKRSAYVESDETAPLSAYGRSKRAGELETLAADPGHLVVRSSWLFGVGGRNFVETMLRLGRERDELAVVDDQVGCPTFTGHLAEGLVTLLERRASGIRHVTGGGDCSWLEFAREIFHRAGLRPAVRPITTAEMGRPARRPPYSALASEHDDTPVLPPWREGLDRYLARREVLR
jgi:dTDP-4-dehydrorhamnose reductase